ncbi:LAETG motif-containing sortase-dependent surface protein [Streptomyces sp. SP17BM10]|uniref:LAETG motif-containing sortase-dependent surface protein n=1 Tax=Streptomyces sp. SP17BM10 TaxID=3002530 RepID=UPI002E7757A8|nr:LAETG motif-containing sortase-dependent surface protein [Streptomyces sp. SP17BM10]MEE1785717.1 LAETG motif-containing sortase-dependent surface protein [Streptomyces sp. SP17BM10]
MRSSRLLAASTLVALSLGATVGAAAASAVGITPTPTTTGAPTTAAPTTPAPTTGTPTAKPTVLPVPTPTNSDRCHGGVYQSGLLKVTGTGLYGTTLVKGGPAAELSLTWENTSGVDLPVVHHSLYLTDEMQERPVDWSPEFFTVQLKTADGWKQLNDKDRVLQMQDFKLAKGEKFTVQLRIAANAKAPAGKYGGNYEAGSDAFDNDKVPNPANDKPNACTQFLADHEGTFQVVEAGSATTAPAATTPAATTPATAAASPSASPAAGPHLAETGASSNTLPIAVGGAAVLVAGAGTLFLLRRRKAGANG